METSTEGVAEAATDDPTAAKAAATARPGTAEEPEAAGAGAAPTEVASGLEGGDTSVDGPRAPEAELAARPGTADEPDPADAGTAPTAIAVDHGGRDAVAATGATQASLTEGAAGTAEAPDRADARTTPTEVADEREGGDTSAERAWAAEAALAARPGTAEEPDTADTPTAVPAGQQDMDTSADRPGAAEAALAAGTADAPTTPTAAPVGQQDDDVAVNDLRAADVVGAEMASAVTGAGGGSRVGGGLAAAPASLSPSRANDFMQCPLLYRFRVIDRLPEKPSAAATRGTLVHSVLERLFDAPAGERTAPAAKSLIPGQWDRLRESRPEVLELFADDPDGERLATWLAEAEQLVERWFTLEDPTRLEPAERELFVEAELDSGLRLRGIIDRVDVAPTGEVRIVDYKTGKAPRPEYAEGALFQMKFYALVVWRLKNVIPRRLQLVYLGSGDVLTYDPVLADLERVERKLLALWEAIRQATHTGDWRPRPTKLCGWCDHQEHCPEFGGTPPPYPLPVKSATGEQGRMGPD